MHQDRLTWNQFDFYQDKDLSLFLLFKLILELEQNFDVKSPSKTVEKGNLYKGRQSAHLNKAAIRWRETGREGSSSYFTNDSENKTFS